MLKMKHLSRYGIVVLLMLPAWLGCGRGGVATYPVQGQIVFPDGKPVQFGQVEFYHADHDLTSRGTIHEDGSFELGTFEDDYGGRHTITQEAWSYGTEARYEIDWWFGSQGYLIARNAADNAADAGLWTRIDWVELPVSGEGAAEPARRASDGAGLTGDSDDWTWGYCLSAWDADSRPAARRVDSADRSAPASRPGRCEYTYADPALRVP